MKKFRTEGELPGDVGLKIRRAVNRTADGEKEVLVFGEINDGSHIERGIIPAAGLHGGAMINFAADQEVVPHLALEHRAAKVIVNFAKDGGYDLVVVGHSDHSELWGRLLGDTADRISDHAHCSVLIVKA